jgi:uncharacterized protein YdeI (YjbR/CyaY-like superfamily)
MAGTDPRIDESFEKASLWREEARGLRQVLLDCGLAEELKWGKPCYTLAGKNVAIIQRMNDFLALLFFKGALLDDPDGVLEPPGPNSRVGRRIRFTGVEDVRAKGASLRASIRQAIEVEKAGLTVENTTELDLPDELRSRFDEDPDFRAAFERLTPGRQRGYALHFSGAKQPGTRAARVEKHVPRILAGKGLHDR